LLLLLEGIMLFADLVLLISEVIDFVLPSLELPFEIFVFFFGLDMCSLFVLLPFS